MPSTMRAVRLLPLLLALLGLMERAEALRLSRVGNNLHTNPRTRALSCSETPIASPFESEAPAAKANSGPLVGPLPLTEENVERVLDELRPYLMADGGNVAIAEIDGGVVRLELQGACGSCASSAMTMKMGLERGLREKIPEIVAVEQVAPDGPQLSEEGVEGVLAEIRPFLKMAGGTCDLVNLETAGVAPSVTLAISGSGSTINSVRAEIAQRLKRNFPSLANVQWQTTDGK